MVNVWRVILVLGLILCCCEVPASAQVAEGRLEVVALQSGDKYEGLILEENKELVRFRCVVRRPGTRTRSWETTFERSEIRGLERLPEPERQELRQWLDALDPKGERERDRMQALTLTKAAWPEGQEGWRYEGKYLVLTSNAKEEVVRQVAVRLDDLFEAFVANLGAKRQPNQLIQVFLYRTGLEYQKRLASQGVNILNPAYYDTQSNGIVAASDVERWTDELESLRRKHNALFQELDQQEKRLKKHFLGQPPASMMNQLQRSRRALQALNTENEATLEQLTRPLFVTLYHEAFHAYLDNYVYPTNAATVPIWLNEGLAQVFEVAFVEGGELRVGHVDSQRLAAVQQAIKDKKLVPLTDLLQSEPKHFQVAHRNQTRESDRYFMAAWALAHYVTFEEKLLNTRAMDKYVAMLSTGRAPTDAFHDLMGKSLQDWESDWHQFLLRLRPDGTLKPLPKQP